MRIGLDKPSQTVARDGVVVGDNNADRYCGSVHNGRANAIFSRIRNDPELSCKSEGKSKDC
jgi:hypothetical protein